MIDSLVLYPSMLKDYNSPVLLITFITYTSLVNLIVLGIRFGGGQWGRVNQGWRNWFDWSLII